MFLARKFLFYFFEYFSCTMYHLATKRTKNWLLRSEFESRWPQAVA